MVNAVASGGTYTQPYLYAGQVDEHLHFTETAQPRQSVRIVSARTASLLREFMKASVDSGTSRKGKPDYGTAGAKTATAQTGRYVNGVELDESWYAGFYPYENPKFTIVVFAEGGDGGGSTCGPVFREIADGLYGYVS
jgi:cell division protein FtsI/penicillin-binding protein 2